MNNYDYIFTPIYDRRYARVAALLHDLGLADMKPSDVGKMLALYRKENR